MDVIRMVMLALCGACKNNLLFRNLHSKDKLSLISVVEFMIKVGENDQFLVKYVI